MAERDFHLSLPAIADLADIECYLAERSPAAAERVIDALVETFSGIASFPDAGSRLDDFRPGLRMSLGTKPADKFVIFYSFDALGVLISRVLHSARNWPEILKGDA